MNAQVGSSDMLRARILLLPTWIGAGLGFVAYLFLGAVPGLLYGGYMGLVMAGTLLGMPVEPTLAAKIITGSGMLLGLVASLFFFVVVGAFVGAVVGWPFLPLLRRVSARQARPAVKASSSP